MSTNDVPGARPENHDELGMGCWAEHDDGSLVLVESTEAGRVVYSIFDMSKEPPIEYRDAMAEATFKRTFSYDQKAGGIKWTWHDKTPFPWDRVIKAGASDGPRMPSAKDTLTAAERVAQSLKLRGAELDADRFDQEIPKARSIWERIKTAIERELGP